MTATERADVRRAFVAARPYPLDEFQIEALDILDRDESVLVAAPTGSGKTVVAEYGVERALARRQRAFYTTPLKALSNQKYADLSRAYGADRVGLLTGDISLNPGADVVVMTTEVLRNMAYAAPRELDDLGCAVLDEVHFLEDRYRGSVWEEIILTAPAHVTLVCLSATVSNAEELAAWIRSVRGEVGTVIEERRPISLTNLYVVRRRDGAGVEVFPTFLDAAPNPDALAADRRGRPRQGAPTPPRRGPRPETNRPRRTDVVEEFAKRSLLPAIYFIFSRQGCDDAVRFCLDDGMRLTTPEERAEIRAVADDHVDALSAADLRVLRYDRFLAGLEAGITAHHAGLVPPFRETVEELFSKALVKVVFATETLALGINMPARSVVIESLSKYTGAGHDDLSPGEYTQLTGRAGRRGIDEAGFAAVLASPYHRFEDVASLASSRTQPLRSSFRPTYNMVANLVRRYDRDTAYRLVSSSFAQFQSERPLRRDLDSVVRVLAERGYLEGWRLTDAGRRLASLYHDCDLLITEAIGNGLFDGLDAPSLAGVASMFTFEARRRRGRAELPTARLARRVGAIEDLAAEIRADERRARLSPTRDLDAGFFSLAYSWASGSDLSTLLQPPRRGRRFDPEEGSISGGDFVRNVKQLVDLLRQIAVAGGTERLAATARRAADDLLRGIVLASSLPPVVDAEERAEIPSGGGSAP